MTVEGGPSPAGATAPVPEPRAAAPYVAACLLVGVATVAAIAAVPGAPVAAALPALAVAVLYGVCKAPLRVSATGLVLLLLSLDVAEDAETLWHTPLMPLGEFLHANLDHFFHGSIPRLAGISKLSGMELLLLFLLAIGIYRKATHSTIDTRGQTQTAGVVGDVVLVFLVSVAYAAANGLATGGSPDMVILQVRPLLHVPILFFLFHAAFRGPADHVLLGRVVVAAALVKAALAVWIAKVVGLSQVISYMTNHGESVLFSMACVVVLTRLMERADRAALWRAVLVLPVLFLGMYANKRRLAWVDLGLALVGIYVVTPRTRWKRTLARVVLVAVPIALLYVGAGWNSSSRFFGPARFVRGLADSKVDRSTLYRDIENWNLVVSISQRPVLGRGFGHPFSEYIHGDDISSVFALYQYEPHNAVLGLLLFGGLFAFTGMWALLAVPVFLAVRSYRHARQPADRAAALCCMSAVVVVCIQTYGDIGPYSTQWQVFLALALAVSGKLAVATGAWPRRVRGFRPAGPRPTRGLALRPRPAGAPPAAGAPPFTAGTPS